MTQMRQRTAPPKEVREAVRQDLMETRGMKMAAIAKTLNVSRNTVNFMLSNTNTYFQARMAGMLHQAFGYSEQYLRYGEGQLQNESIPENSQPDAKTERERILNRYLQISDSILTILQSDGLLETDYNDLYAAPEFKCNNFTPRNTAEEESYALLTLRLSKIRQLTDIQRILNLLEQPEE